jgi:hypothetical protein
MAEVRFLVGARYSCLIHSIQTRSGAHPASYPMGTGGSSLEVEQPWREGDHSLPSSAKVMNGGPMPPHPTRIHGVVLN